MDYPHAIVACLYSGRAGRESSPARIEAWGLDRHNAGRRGTGPRAGRRPHDGGRGAGAVGAGRAFTRSRPGASAAHKAYHHRFEFIELIENSHSPLFN